MKSAGVKGDETTWAGTVSRTGPGCAFGVTAEWSCAWRHAVTPMHLSSVSRKPLNPASHNRRIITKRHGMNQEFSVVIERDVDGYFVASVPALRGCHTQARSLDVLMKRIREVIELGLEVERPVPSVAVD
jgi:predicted RNase H-like HicB family nuclease